jgi:hypothetical protein
MNETVVPAETVSWIGLKALYSSQTSFGPGSPFGSLLQLAFSNTIKENKSNRADLMHNKDKKIF